MKAKYLILLFIPIVGCQKYLDMKPDKKMVVPARIEDLQALLDNTNLLVLSHPGAGENAADDYYLTDADWEAMPLTYRNNYVWGTDMYNDNDRNDWSLAYENVQLTNVVLDNVSMIKGNDSVKLKDIEGQALFHRAFAFFTLLQVFALPYTGPDADKIPGIALRLTSDFHAHSKRSNLKECYLKVLSDLKLAADFLPALQPVPTRPSKAACFGLLSRVYLSMSAFSESLKYADSALTISGKLMDYNTLTANAAYPIARFNQEVVFHSLFNNSGGIYSARAKIDSLLLDSYSANDLRKNIFFRSNGNGSYAFRGSYGNGNTLFDGVATDELYLNKAEGLARADKVQDAMEVLNSLLVSRWKSGTFVPYSAASQDDALRIILSERRKELVMRNIRWMDIRRLSSDLKFAITLHRTLNGVEYVLPPGDKRYAMPIPLKVIEMTGMQQN